MLAHNSMSATNHFFSLNIIDTHETCIPGLEEIFSKQFADTLLYTDLYVPRYLSTLAVKEIPNEEEKAEDDSDPVKDEDEDDDEEEEEEDVEWDIEVNGGR